MARVVSLIVLIVILLLIAVLFFWVMAAFLLPLFLATVLAVVFRPMHHWFVARCRGRERTAAGLTTTVVMLLVLGPIVAIVIPAAFQGVAIYHAVRDLYEDLRAEELQKVRVSRPAGEADVVVRVEPSREEPAAVAPPARSTSESPEVHAVSAIRLLAVNLSDFADRTLGLDFDPADIERTVTLWVKEWLTPLAVSMTQFLANLAIGTIIMAVALYFFLADGPMMVRQIMRLSPLDDRYEAQLIEEFNNVCRAVVLATLLSAVAQALLLGLGLLVTGFEAVFLLTVLTMLVAMIPFVGTTVVWVPASLWLYFHDGRTWAAILLAVYGAAVVGMADNFIKPWILHGRSNLHPLLALLSVLGGVQALGPIGIFVGPMVVAFFHALLKMFASAMTEAGRPVSAAK